MIAVPVAATAVGCAYVPGQHLQKTQPGARTSPPRDEVEVLRAAAAEKVTSCRHALSNEICTKS